MFLQRGKLCTAVASNGVVYDSSPPTTAEIDIPSGWRHLERGAFYQTNSTHITVEWAKFVDPHTAVTDVRIGLGTFGTGTDIHELVSVPVNTTRWIFGPKAGDSVLLQAAPNNVHGGATPPCASART